MTSTQASPAPRLILYRRQDNGLVHRPRLKYRTTITPPSGGKAVAMWDLTEVKRAASVLAGLKNAVAKVVAKLRTTFDKLGINALCHK
jgi:hypothetical protein